MNGLDASDPRAVALAACGSDIVTLSSQLERARAAQRLLVREALSAGASYRWIAARSGLSLGAVQRLAAGEVTEPETESDATIVTPPTSTSPLCVRGRCTAPAVEGRRFCPAHMWT